MTSATSLSDVVPAEALGDVERSGPLADLATVAEAVVCPGTTEEVAETIRWAAANGVGVLPAASGARLGVGRREGRFIVLGTGRLSGIDIYEPADVSLTAKAGTPLTEVSGALAEHRQALPFDPPHVSDRTLGGLVAAGESGPAATGYGELRNHVLGATVVCGDGRVLALGGRVVKNVAGFDLLRPVVGSRGRLCVITSVCLRAFPVPAIDRVLVARSDTLGELADIARAIRTASVLPVSVVALSPAPVLGSSAALFIRLHGAEATVDADQATLERLAGASFECPDEPDRVMAAARDAATEGATTLRLSCLPSDLFAVLAAVQARFGKATVQADAYGGQARVSVDTVEPEVIDALCHEVESKGGALRVERTPGGVARGSRPTDAEVELATALERVFDPAGVFWPCRM